MIFKEGLLLRSVSLDRTHFRVSNNTERFPFNVPVIRSLETLEFSSQVTFLVGENGSGKSTLLEAIAAAANSITVGRESVDKDASLEPIRTLASTLKLTWSKKTRRGFFMRSEDFFGFARRMTELRAELQRDVENIDQEYKDRSEYARLLAQQSYNRELHGIQNSYGDGLDTQSHGESYLKLFQSRFVPEGLYLLDEPEAPLSPLRQLSFLVLLKEMTGQKSQFIIATHSPILMAFPGAAILTFDKGVIEEVDYNDLEHVRITREFLEDPNRYLNHLFQ